MAQSTRRTRTKPLGYAFPEVVEQPLFPQVSFPQHDSFVHIVTLSVRSAKTMPFPSHDTHANFKGPLSYRQRAGARAP